MRVVFKAFQLHYHDAMDHKKFQNRVDIRFIPTWKGRYPELPCCLVLDYAPFRMGGIINSLL